MGEKSITVIMEALHPQPHGEPEQAHINISAQGDPQKQPVCAQPFVSASEEIWPEFIRGWREEAGTGKEASKGARKEGKGMLLRQRKTGGWRRGKKEF